ncbi:hypothetical protein ACGE0T_15815 [Parabacteroides sp. APC149_11_2_Y6]
MRHIIHTGKWILILFLGAILSSGCNQAPSGAIQQNELPSIYPDYMEATIPVNIAPLNFRILPEGNNHVVFSTKGYQFTISGSDYIDIPEKKWKQLLGAAKGDSITVSVYNRENGHWLKYKSFHWYVPTDSIDNYLVYRLIEPTYANWNQMGIYQRNLSSFSETEIISNDKTGHNCMNCHSFNQRDPHQMVLHMRKTNPGTLLIKDGKITKLDTQTQYTISNFVYPYWHPSGNDIAFSTNNTQMSFFEANDKLIEVYDLYSDIVLYNIDKNEVYTSPLLSAKDQLENFPVFSPDGKTLYFCSCPRVDSLPQNFEQVKYQLCSIGFDADNRTFSPQVDTLVNLTQKGKGVSLPSISPNGQYILCSVASSGCFLSWDKNSDLFLYDTHSKELRLAEALNTDQSESYTSWSSNSRWIIFSSRRLDGVYNRPYIAYINEKGEIGKPFILPQKHPDFYQYLFKAYNLPQLVSGKVTINPHEIAETVKSPNSQSVKFRQGEHQPAVTEKTAAKSEVN